MNNITIGQYIPGNSWIYKMDPRIKIILTFIFMAVIFILPSILSVSIALLIFFVIIITARIPLLKMISGLKGVVYLMLFTFVLQICYTKGSSDTLIKTLEFHFSFITMSLCIILILIYMFTKKYIPFKMIYFLVVVALLFVIQYVIDYNTLFNLTYKLKVYEEGLVKGGFISIRVILMVSLTSLLTFTTSTMEIQNGITSVLSPLKLLHIPVEIFSMMLSLTLRFIPTLLEETKKIMDAQSSRGVDFSEGGLKSKITQIISLLVPMFVISFRRAEELSNAMISRGYDLSAKRTRYDKLKLHFIDYFSLILSLFVLAFTIYLRVI